MLGIITYLIVSRSVGILSFPSDIGTPEFKIIGGRAVQNRSDFSYQVSLRYMGFHFCGGAIIDYNFIVTAAHCCFDGDNKLLNKNYLSVVAGNLELKNRLRNTTSRNVASVYVHPQYNSESIENDLALWQMSSPLLWTNYIQPVELASRKMETNTRCNVSGWGVTDYQKKVVQGDLQYVEIPIVSKTACKKIYISLDPSRVLCAGEAGKDSCQGDSGGPLVCNGSLTGIVSYGINCGTYPGVYTDIYAYRSWIKSKIVISAGTNLPTNNFLLIGFGITALILLLAFKLF